MKLLFLASLLCSLNAFGQDFDSTDYSYNYEGLKSSMTKQQLFSHLRVAVANNFNSYKEVVELEDTLTGIILIRPLFQVVAGQGAGWMKKEGRVRYSMRIVAKEGSYTIKVSDFVHSSYATGADGASGGNLANEKPACGWARISKKGWQHIRDKAKTEATLATLYIAREIDKL